MGCHAGGGDDGTEAPGAGALGKLLGLNGGAVGGKDVNLAGYAKAARVSTAFRATARSLALPMMTATFCIAFPPFLRRGAAGGVDSSIWRDEGRPGPGQTKKGTPVPLLG